MLEVISKILCIISKYMVYMYMFIKCFCLLRYLKFDNWLGGNFDVYVFFDIVVVVKIVFISFIFC